jgi:hypothetical protein
VNELDRDISQAAAKAADMCASRNGISLDYTAASLTRVEDMLAEAADFVPDMTPERVATLAQDFGCYILEVGRREFGGRYCWFDKRDLPVLVVGEPRFRVALLAWDKVRSRLSGDKADNIPFFYAGFAERVRQAKPGDDALYV